MPTGFSVVSGPMRPAIIHLFLLLLIAGGLHAEDALTLQATTDREFYLSGARNSVYLELKVGTPVAPAAPGAAAPVRNIVLVLDRSGSMAGAPVQALREAVAAALKLLNSGDIVSVVLFGSEVETLIEARRRDQLENLDALLASIEPAGGAALYDALNQAAALLRRHAGPATSNHLILLTDGPATKGPREPADFISLAEVFAREPITLSTIGLGPDFNEDLLATMARVGRGRFRYAAAPDNIAGALLAELTPTGALLAREVVLTAEFGVDCRKLESYAWAPAVMKDMTATYRFPYIFAGQDLTVLLGAEMETRRFSYPLAKIRLTWTGVADGEEHALELKPVIRPEQDAEVVRRSANVAVVRTAVGSVISDGLQKTIEEMDKGDLRKAQRELRRARSTALDLNYSLDDAQVQASIAQLDPYLAEVQARGLNPSDRKLLRSGLNNRFATPTAGESKEK